MNDNQNGQNNQSWVDIGEQIRDVVQSALDSGDFKELNNTVASTVNSAISEVKKQFKNAAEDIKTNQPSPEQKYKYQAKPTLVKPYYAQKSTVRRTWNPPFTSMIKFKKIGNISGNLLVIFGGIGFGITLGITLMLLFSFSIKTILICIAILFLFASMIQRGNKKINRLKRAKKYLELCEGKMYVDIDVLARYTDKKRKYILKDVKKMLKLGFFPQGHLDEKGTCLMLNDVVYNQYLNLQKEQKVQFQAEKTEEKINNENEEPVNSELDTMIAEGNDYIKKLRDLNDIIEGEVISDKLYQLENILKDIFNRVKEHPNQMPQMHKCMDYYLPTTLKLVQAYAEFDEVSVPGEDIISAKAEIEKTLDTINLSFVELLNNLFRDTVFDITTDAQVLQTMLAKEGLTREAEWEKVPR